MPETEAYRPGILSSFLLGGGPGEGGGGEEGNANATRPSKKKAGNVVGVSGVEDAPTREQQQSATATPEGSPPSATKRKKKKKDKKGEENEPCSSSRGGNASSDGGGAAATGVGQGAAAESLRPAAAAAAAAGGGAEQEPLAEAPDLASLFSKSNLKKFKRRERVDREADAAEVCADCVGASPCLCACIPSVCAPYPSYPVVSVPV